MTNWPDPPKPSNDTSPEAEASDPPSQLNKSQLANLRRCLENPSPIASPEHVASVLAKFKV